MARKNTDGGSEEITVEVSDEMAKRIEDELRYRDETVSEFVGDCCRDRLEGETG